MPRVGALAFSCLVLCGSLLLGTAGAEKAAVTPVTVSHVSGKPVPRFEALRYAAVNGRTGPSQDHPIAWRYERAGLPVLVLKETQGWRFVRDPDGDEVWMHARTLTATDMAMVREPLTLLASPAEGASAKGRVEAGAIMSLGRCEDGFCHVSSGRRGGWAPIDALWGAGLAAPSSSEPTG
ncbi:MAG: SH3 domain-containing protein [Pseudomonadota bacterium]